ncbi:GrpB family protein [Exercitatus varius]|uniref:GrpB family protein n=1 Tax=Exercitatus varius TaxID=67857 RepID=A0AAW6QAZ9_9PAST|nr:GrpB family protein [Exercitatus varius]MDG2950537.1 GrpB family protein [Exercitatus varius]
MTNKALTEMSLEELWRLFPIRLEAPNPDWRRWYEDERLHLLEIIREPCKISHIGSTAVQTIWAKPTVDILIELEDRSALQHVSECLSRNGYLRMSATDTRIVYNKGYTSKGFAERVFHLHLRLFGDNDELYFRDYLLAHPDIAQAYERLKLSLWKQYEYDRDSYTEAKTDFIRRYTELAKKEFKDKYQRVKS